MEAVLWTLMLYLGYHGDDSYGGDGKFYMIGNSTFVPDYTWRNGNGSTAAGIFFSNPHDAMISGDVPFKAFGSRLSKN